MPGHVRPSPPTPPDLSETHVRGGLAIEALPTGKAIANMWGWLFLAAVITLIYLTFFRSTPEAEDEQEPLEIQDFTPLSLKKYNGVDDRRVLLAVDGKVFDVTAGKAHYGPTGPYAAFAGRDASRGLAKHSFDESMLTPLNEPLDTLSDLTPSERESLEQWKGFFESKYPYCGRLINA